MNREVHVRFWESAELGCLAPLTYLRAYETVAEARRLIGRFWISSTPSGRTRALARERQTTPISLNCRR